MDIVSLVILVLIGIIAAYIFLDRICKCIQYVAVCKTFSNCAKASRAGNDFDKEMSKFMGSIMQLSKGKSNDGKRI